MENNFLEWPAFLLVIASVYAYGHNKGFGGFLGAVAALLFVAWGIFDNLYGMLLINFILALVHIRNMIIHNYERS